MFNSSPPYSCSIEWKCHDAVAMLYRLSNSVFSHSNEQKFFNETSNVFSEKRELKGLQGRLVQTEDAMQKILEQLECLQGTVDDQTADQIRKSTMVTIHNLYLFWAVFHSSNATNLECNIRYPAQCPWETYIDGCRKLWKRWLRHRKRPRSWRNARRSTWKTRYAVELHKWIVLLLCVCLFVKTMARCTNNEMQTGNWWTQWWREWRWWWGGWTGTLSQLSSRASLCVLL